MEVGRIFQVRQISHDTGSSSSSKYMIDNMSTTAS